MKQLSKQTTVIVPVYGDWPSLKDCIKSLQSTVSKYDTVVFANDFGPDRVEIESKLLKMIRSNENFHYYANDKNLGFLQNCNNAVLNYDKTNNDIILLNSDTITTKGFIEELRAVAYDDDRIATVCPRSNNATIASVPRRLRSAKESVGLEEAYEIYKSVSEMLPRYSVSPVSVGFCIYIKRSVIKEYGLFDELYRKGYGEEDDFCMRMNQNGFISVISNHSFVFHQGARSFTPEKREEFVSANAKVLIGRFPYFPKLVSDYLEFPDTAAEHFAETIYAQKSQEVKKVLIDLHSLPTHDIGFTDDIRKTLKSLKSNEKISYTVTTSNATKKFLSVDNNKLEWIEPHMISSQYDVSYSMIPITNLNNVKILRDVAYVNLFHRRCVDEAYNNAKKIDQKLQRAKEILLLSPNSLIVSVDAIERTMDSLKKDGSYHISVQDKWTKLNILLSDSVVLKSKKNERIEFAKKYLRSIKRLMR